MKTGSLRLHAVCVALLLFAFPGRAVVGQEAVYDLPEADRFLTRWMILGPISISTPVTDAPHAAVEKSRFETDWLSEADGGEAHVDPLLAADIVVANERFRWQYHESDNDTVDLRKLLGDQSGVVAYAAAILEAPSEMATVLAVGSDDAIRIWLNGELIHDHWVARPLAGDEDLVGATLHPGPNRLLIKVFNASREWGFAIRSLSAEQQAERLVRSAAHGNDEEVRKLLNLGVAPDAVSSRQITALQAARMRGYDHIAELLIAEGATEATRFPTESFVEASLARGASPEGPGVAVLVAQGGEILFSKAYGAASLEHDIPVTTRTKFRIGSVTKQFTAAAILKLQEEGKLSIDDPLSKYIADFPRGDEVKVHHLLTHTSGIHSYSSKPDFMASVASGTTPEKLIESFKHDPFDFAPGEKWQYNNSGYFLLGYIIEQVSGMSYGDYLRATFFEPLGMHDTGVHTATAILKHEATGYSVTPDGTSKAPHWDMSRAGAAGNLYSTVEDLQRWNEALFGGQVLSEELLQAAFTPVQTKDTPVPYGFGWMIDEFRGLKRISHSGGFNGFLSQLVRFPDQDLTIVVLHNASPPLPELNPGAVAQTLAEAYLWESMQGRPRYEVAQDVAVQIFQDYLGRYDYGGAVLTVTLEENRLFAQLTGQARFEIFPASDTRFFWKVVDAQVEFLRGDNGEVTAARHTQGGITFDAARIKDEVIVEVAPEVLEQYVGKYTLQGIGVLTIRRQDNQLYVQLTGQPEFEMYPKSENEFFLKVVNAQLTFVRDDEGAVEQVLLLQGGATLEAKRTK